MFCNVAQNHPPELGQYNHATDPIGKFSSLPLSNVYSSVACKDKFFGAGFGFNSCNPLLNCMREPTHLTTVALTTPGVCMPAGTGNTGIW